MGDWFGFFSRKFTKKIICTKATKILNFFVAKRRKCFPQKPYFFTKLLRYLYYCDIIIYTCSEPNVLTGGETLNGEHTAREIGFSVYGPTHEQGQNFGQVQKSSGDAKPSRVGVISYNNSSKKECLYEENT